jgi:hypothetical protein
MDPIMGAVPKDYEYVPPQSKDIKIYKTQNEFQ